MVNVPRRAALVAVILALSAASVPALADPPDPDPWFAADKALHFGVATAIAGGGYGLCALVADDVLSRSIVGTGFSVGAVSFKEALDWAGYGTPSAKDVAWGLAGTVVGIGLSISIDLAVRSAQPTQTQKPR